MEEEVRENSGLNGKELWVMEEGWVWEREGDGWMERAVRVEVVEDGEAEW